MPSMLASMLASLLASIVGSMLAMLLASMIGIVGTKSRVAKSRVAATARRVKTPP